jgi:mutator protein MutT
MDWTIPVSAKGIIFNTEGKALLLRNERNLWELPGGRIEKGEQPEQTVFRELYEEIGIKVEINKLVNVWVYEVLEDKHVLIITYLCGFEGNQEIQMSEEHIEYGWFSLSELEDLAAAEGYKKSIRMV